MKDKKKKTDKKSLLKDMEKSWKNEKKEIKTDVMGSYTGTVFGDEYEIPQQDADDL